MKHLRKLCAVLTLFFVLSLSARAGEITTWGVAPPPPPPATAIETGDITTGGIASSIDSETLVTEITLSLLQLLSVF